MSSVNMNSLMAARNAILNQNNALQDIAKNASLGGPGQTSGPKETAGSNSFSTQLTSALQEVNRLQSTAEEEMKSYQMGESNDVAAVMLAKHKASLGFETTLQVRNKLLSAYKDIMNMPV
ncbi:flagellar hook-basal body complex protein FliE [Parasphingorhabdus halotolerans]|uniref:Flagellar hook-basal body complex protein FliE n=1 Tax=Parasphingorhabdus halotolerans TaxID=2725558 RepID=A0A6H2DIP9_9SPHN|nr:flagellar hook-basal body complex protein FliE [Parasphingorhabdus halotolerans]QJB68017.1 flagellar hook-basal body complex protein FliE [Parasphingorhabdus halotolerans]